MNQTAAAFRFYDYHPAPADLHAEVVRGLGQEKRSIPPKFFYDEEGSRLFNAICATPEYYLTRVEMGIIRRNLKEIAGHIGTGCLLIEPGSGDCRKVRELLAATRPQAYVPMDISRACLQRAAGRLAAEFPGLEVRAVCADFTAPIDLPCLPQGPRRVAFFPGSSIGNFDPREAVDFLSHLAAMVQPGGGLLIGVDLKKDAAVLNAAYNDAQGLTAAFNLNLLARINRDLGANFKKKQFRHHAFYNQGEGRIEMHLVSESLQQVLVGDRCFDFYPGDGIHTENSHKYTIAEFQELAWQAGFRPTQFWTDASKFFSVHFLAVEG